jgi:hypothetical protein
MMIRPIALMFCMLAMLPWPSAACAQAQFKEVTVGAWTVSEDLYGDTDDENTPPAKPTGRPNSAYTRALDGRNATLGFTCPDYSVIFSFDTNDENFNSAQGPSEHFDSDIYTKVDSDDLRRTVLYHGYVSYFQTFPESLMRGANFMVCPTRDDKSSLCVNFSLKGITAALKMVCPKR